MKSKTVLTFAVLLLAASILACTRTPPGTTPTSTPIPTPTPVQLKEGSIVTLNPSLIAEEGGLTKAYTKPVCFWEGMDRPVSSRLLFRLGYNEEEIPTLYDGHLDDPTGTPFKEGIIQEMQVVADDEGQWNRNCLIYTWIRLRVRVEHSGIYTIDREFWVNGDHLLGQ